eukprot:maker-scaffold214_size254108-snap-gene-0.16 protein:Tk01528 transcript:maker-scaffold214_size254108-snap-gene-0.16-mRNA-1 annotation:"caax prenyl protease 1 homolog"
MDPDLIFYGVLGFSWVEFVWEGYLSHRQRKIYTTHTKVPPQLDSIMSAETFEKARAYALDKSRFGAVQGIFNQLLSTVLMWFLGFKLVWDISGDLMVQQGYPPQENEILRSVVFTLIFNVFNTIIGLPFSIYSTFVVEERHGFNKQTMAFYIKDQIKSFVLGQAIMLPLLGIVIKIIQIGGDFFFIYLWFFILLFTLFMMIIYPEFIAPWFDKYTPLPDGDLRHKIEELAASIEFPLYKLFVVEGSKRSSHSNAYFYGFFNFKRIVLFDTLLEASEREKLKSEEDKAKEAEKEEKEKEEDKAKGCTTNEILAVLGHELGHWKLNHVLKNILISEVHIFLMFALFGYLFRYQPLYTAFGFPKETPILMGLMIIMQFITAPYNALLNFLMTALSRKFEFQADEFAVGLGKAADLKTALIKLNNDNLSFPIFDHLFTAWHHSHPPLMERLSALESKKQK